MQYRAAISGQFKQSGKPRFMCTQLKRQSGGASGSDEAGGTNAQLDASDHLTECGHVLLECTRARRPSTARLLMQVPGFYMGNKTCWSGCRG